jgi:tetratricopeptide (TPR) repeat protein
MRILGLSLGLLALLPLGGGDGTDWLRVGNAAYSQGDYEGALEAFARAIPASDDPGQVAFARAAAHYQLGQFQQSEQAYRQCLEDAEGRRRLEALYGLGNALARQGQSLRGRRGVEALQAALQAYQDCLAMELKLRPDEGTEVLDAAAHNHQQVEALLVKKRGEQDNTPDPMHEGNNEPRPMNGGQQQPKERPEGPPEQGPTEPPAPGQTPRSTQETQAGKGNLPPLPDDPHAPPLDPSQAKDHLNSQLDRIRRDRSQRRSSNAPPLGTVRDW